MQASLGKPFFGSLTVHALIASALFAMWFLKPARETLGSPLESSGSVGVTMTPSIPIPAREGQINKLAHNTDSVIPPPPPKKIEQIKTPPLKTNAIPIPSRVTPHKPQPEQTSHAAYKPQPVRTNQVYSDIPPAMASPTFSMQGNNGVGLGQNTTLGTRFGAYVDLMRQRIAGKWNKAGLANDGHKVLMTFSILRDGTVQDVKVAQTSGNYSLDTSAQRAILEASPLPELPSGLGRDSAQVELWFQVK